MVIELTLHSFHWLTTLVVGSTGGQAIYDSLFVTELLQTDEYCQLLDIIAQVAQAIPSSLLSNW